MKVNIKDCFILVCRTDFTFAGRRYKAGELFIESIAKRRLDYLMGSSLITLKRVVDVDESLVKEEKEAAKAETPEKKAPVKKGGRGGGK